jgi:hypothetical protein
MLLGYLRRRYGSDRHIIRRWESEDTPAECPLEEPGEPGEDEPEEAQPRPYLDGRPKLHH